ncbi:hypothetical protein M422DRAFT_239010 [Sphaerobolus stellatus SS14]|nr:hypothetical protein M422DRAFT_239010 [Sphaerobolus stellatus SS14]
MSKACLLKFRILVVGKSGVGKSSLINHAFSVDVATVSHKTPGKCDINVEIKSSQNDRFVLHDSQGFEAGETTTLETVKQFIRSRSGSNVDIKDRVHAIWLCIQIPVTGARVFETGDEEFLKFIKNSGEIPMVVVFTQFDSLVSYIVMNLTDEELDSIAEITKFGAQKADIQFDEICLKPLRNLAPKLPHTSAKTSVKPAYRKTLADLIEKTQTLVQNHVEGDVWIVSAMAQRASVQAKIDSSIQVGMKQYWSSLASSTNLVGWSLEECLNILHRDITLCWNFFDPGDLLNSKEFRERVLILAQLATPETTADGKSWFNDMDKVQTLMGFAIIGAAVPALGAISLTGTALRWTTRIYQQTPEVLRCLMAYVIDLTLVMDILFLDTLALHPPRRLTKVLIDSACEQYRENSAVKVHHGIREYVNKSTWSYILKANNAEEKMIELIKKHCRVI